MTIKTYAGLSTAVFRRLNRTAETTVFNDCIELAEAEINRRLALKPVRPMHIVATATLNGEYIADPTTILDVDSLSIDGVPVKPTSPQNMQDMYERDATEGQPKFYAQVGEQFRLYPTPDVAYTAKLIYWSKVPPLTSVDDTNWLIAAHPDVYFHGVLAHAYQDYFDEANADTQASYFDVALQKVLDAYPHRSDSRPIRMDDMPIIRRPYEVLA